MTATASDSYLVIRALLDEFVRCGMEHACTCPGSRDTPIVLTIAREQRLQAWSHVDERAAGFFALGAAKATGKPVAVTCTSGTAAANLLPAVIEAREAGVPLIVLTADRPPELRDIGAGQTIDQIKLYGDAAKWFFELGVQEATSERLRWVRALACRAYWTAVGGRPGPVHINLPLREPLVLDQPLPDGEPGGGGRPNGEPWLEEQHATPVRASALPNRHEFRRTVFVAGDLGPDPALGRRLAAFAARARVPLLADPLSGARSGAAAVAHFDLILRDPQHVASLRPDVVCRIGDLPTSKPLRTWLSGLDEAMHVQFAADARWIDPVSRTGQRIVGPLDQLLERVEHDEVVPDDSDWLDRWTQADRAVAHAISEPLVAAGLSEPATITALAQLLPSGATLFVGASMPIRDVEEFFPALAEPPRVMANRGANGIDGTVSSAFGVAATGGREVVLVLGDVTLAHDIGGLLAASRLGLKVTLVLLNNDGGGIFNFLPVASEGQVFEQHIATPTGLDFAQAAALYHCRHEHVASFDGLAEALMRALAGAQSTIIEVRTNRVANRRLHADVEAAALIALRESSC
ncbi:MAG TPA: 2-succinyl-5-enolpyruvyl-6-hydroxy-3-cyclohexene-1-carboxylic-acid synthase [Solirubrobacteraceae bacterium]|jgi:2-succinyl-5-enolpyruvyl-6-hydroxy-3-cyclohexene-1-carboxylate synthase|nr:2-succinyl-5-enolpyruvyl-6-hydroxy-3-cyclohexene-1-carboxylic-acid synthase [Solirubrobacteraceae bacterium]